MLQRGESENTLDCLLLILTKDIFYNVMEYCIYTTTPLGYPTGRIEPGVEECLPKIIIFSQKITVKFQVPIQANDIIITLF